MKLQYLRLKNFIGIQVGLGIKEIEIPFYQGRNKICMLLGANGSGKSTILDNAVPQPYITGNDRNRVIIEGEDGEKELWYSRGTLTYKLLIQYKWNKSTESHSTKGYITRINENGDEEELNPNGNITSFKEIIDMEFMLDPAFMRLCKLSQESINVSKMKTTERKTLMASLLDEASAYIEYGKKVNNKCRFLESTIKGLSSKINKIGNIDSIEENIVRVNNLINSTQLELDEYKNQLAVSQAKYNEIDLSGYDSIKLRQRELASILNSIDRKYAGLLSHFIVMDNMSAESYRQMSVQETIELKALKEAEYRTDVNMLTELQEDYNNTKSKLESSITELKVNETNRDSVERLELPEDIQKSISIYENQLREIDEKLDGVEVVYESDKLIKIQDLVQDINLRIDRNLNFITPNLLEALLVSFEKGQCISLKKQFDKRYEIAVATEISVMKKQLPEANEKLYNLKAQQEIRAKLSNRPSNCKIDSCPFIVDAVGIPSDIDTQILELEEKIQKLQIKYKNAREDQDVYTNASRVAEEFQDIYGIIKDNRELLEDAPDNWNFTVQAFVDRIRHNSLFNDPHIDLNSHLIIASLNERYVDITDNILPRLKKDLELSKHTEFIINSYNDKIEACKKAIEEYNKKITELDTMLYHTEKHKGAMEASVKILGELIDIKNLEKDSNDEMNKLNTEESKYKEQVELRMSLKDKIADLDRSINVFNSRLNTLQEERDAYVSNQHLYQEYTSEKTKLEKSFVVHEKVRYALSSKTGIPLIFLDMYLNKTRQYANAILEELFGDEYRLCEFEINATEFRIPCEVRGEFIADISLMSSGERAILSLVISLTLMYQASSSGSYDIITLDEMDAVLDSGNRNRFIEALEKLMEIFKIEQILAVSHNDGFESYPIDLVLLRDYTLESTNNKTIIYKFK